MASAVSSSPQTFVKRQVVLATQRCPASRKK